MDITLGALDLNKEKIKVDLWLAKPNKEIVAKINSAYNIVWNPKLGGVSELSFDIPSEIEINNIVVPNPLLNQVRNKYTVKMNITEIDYTEWFIIEEPTATMDGSRDGESFKCYGLPYELATKQLKSYSTESPMVLQEVVEEVLFFTARNLWTFDSAMSDPIYRDDGGSGKPYRMVDVNAKPTLDFLVNDVTETYNAVIFFNHENRTVYFRKYDTSYPDFYQDRGIRVSYGNLMKSVSEKIDNTDFCTRLRVYGNNNITMDRVNLGQVYIEDYSYFIYPYEEDGGGVVLQSSDYMSDSLAGALLDYQTLIGIKRVEYELVLDDVDQCIRDLIPLDIYMQELRDELAIIEDALDVENTKIDADQYIIDDLWQQRTDKLVEISDTQILIDNKETELEGYYGDLDIIADEVDITSNFTSAQITEWQAFIIEKDISNNFITEDLNNDDEPSFAYHQLYEWGLSEFEQHKNPQINVDVSMVNFLELIEFQNQWDKLRLGDIVTIYYEKLNIYVKAMIMEYTLDFEAGTIGLNIGNVRSMTDFERFSKMLNKGASASTSIDMNNRKWNDAFNTSESVNEIIQNEWDANLRMIQGGLNNTVSISGRGIKIVDENDPLKYLVAQNGILAITDDGGNTFKHAVRSDGIIADRLIGRTIFGENLTLETNDNSLTFDGDGLYVGDKTGNSYMWWDTVDQKLKIKGSLSVSPSGTEFPIPTFREDYVAGTEYFYGDVVKYIGKVWIHINETPSTNQAPSESSIYWTLYVDKGDDGATGDDGADGADGADGSTGAGLVYVGDWVNSTSYFGNDTRRDVVKGTDGQYYICKLNHTSALTTRSISGGSYTIYWQFFGATFTSVATKLLLAENASITQDLLVGGGVGSGYAGVSGIGGLSTSIRFWAGSLTRSTAPFRVQDDGTIYATKGVIGNTTIEKAINSQFLEEPEIDTASPLTTNIGYGLYFKVTEDTRIGYVTMQRSTAGNVTIVLRKNIGGNYNTVINTKVVNVGTTPTRINLDLLLDKSGTGEYWIGNLGATGGLYRRNSVGAFFPASNPEGSFTVVNGGTITSINNSWYWFFNIEFASPGEGLPVAITLGSDGIKCVKGGNTTFHLKSNGDAEFSGTGSFQTVTTLNRSISMSGNKLSFTFGGVERGYIDYFYDAVNVQGMEIYAQYDVNINTGTFLSCGVLRPSSLYTIPTASVKSVSLYNNVVCVRDYSTLINPPTSLILSSNGAGTSVRVANLFSSPGDLLVDNNITVNNDFTIKNWTLRQPVGWLYITHSSFGDVMTFNNSTGQVIIPNNLSVVGDINCNTLSVSGNTTLSGNLTVSASPITMKNWFFEQPDSWLYFSHTAFGRVMYMRHDSGLVNIYNNLNVAGTITKGSSTFLIDHPLDPYNKDLFHAMVEAPRYDLIYRGTIYLYNGTADVNIDEASNMSEGTFDALTQNAKVVSLCNQNGFSRVKSTEIIDGKFTIVCEDNACEDEISWLVIGERNDKFIRNNSGTHTDTNGRMIPERIKPPSESPDDSELLDLGKTEYLIHEQEFEEDEKEEI